MKKSPENKSLMLIKKLVNAMGDNKARELLQYAFDEGFKCGMETSIYLIKTKIKPKNSININNVAKRGLKNVGTNEKARRKREHRR